MADPETQNGTRLSVYLSFTSVSAQQLPSSMLPQIHLAKFLLFLVICNIFGSELLRVTALFSF
jgi:hypothetical protein